MSENKIEFKEIKIVISDFDGIFTDGKLEIFSDGRTSKKIDYQDIMGIAILLKKGIKFAIISGETSAAIDLIKQKFPQVDTFQNERNKLQIYESLLKKYNLNQKNSIYLGDDINDIKCLSTAGHAVSVPNAHREVKKLPNIYITKNKGGNGAFREVVDAIL